MKSHLFLTLAMVITFCGCRSALEGVPDNLVGVWKTAAPKYSDRFLEITKAEIIFGTGGNSFDTYAIARIERVQSDEPVSYDIHYLGEAGEEYTLPIFFESQSGVIRFRNQDKIVWTKAAEGRP